MNYFKMLLLTGALSLSMTACGDNHNEADHSHDAPATEATTAAHGEGQEYTSAYVCPMHCEGSGSDAPGTCPVCGMTYEALATHTENGHSHEQ